MDSIISLPSTGTAAMQAKAAMQITNKATLFFQSSVNTYNGLMVDFWNSTYGLTPQQVSDALGTKAASLFELGLLLKACITGANPSAVLTEPALPFTINQDGTVTISGSN